MNKQRRKEIEIAYQKVADALAVLNNCRDEEQEALDNLPENLQFSKRADDLTDNIDQLEYAIGNLEDALNDIEDLIN